jgi:hypothetical protein
MEPPVLTDKAITPTNGLIFSIIGKNRIHWEKLSGGVYQKYPDALEQWNYYRDGKHWLFRMIYKKKTLFWIGVLKDAFLVTFYFGDKAAPRIQSSSLPENMIADFKTAKHYGKIRAISIRVQNSKDIENCLKLLEIKATV